MLGEELGTSDGACEGSLLGAKLGEELDKADGEILGLDDGILDG